jgi:hypothetical protein
MAWWVIFLQLRDDVENYSFEHLFWCSNKMVEFDSTLHFFESRVAGVQPVRQAFGGAE